MSEKINLTRTIHAIEAYDHLLEKFQQLDAAKEDADKILRALSDLEAAEEHVGYMYGLDTSDRNNVDDCRKYVHPGNKEVSPGEDDVCFVRRMVRDFHSPDVPTL